MLQVSKKVLAFVVMLVLLPLSLRAQQYTGTEGLIHVPTADMDSICSARIGAHYLNKEFTPAKFVFEGEKYNTASIYMSVTPFKWIQLAYTQTLLKNRKDLAENGKKGFYAKDRYFSVRVQPLREKKWWPSVVFGANDIWGENDGKSGSFYFRNYYVALSKHYELLGNVIGAHVAYRHWKQEYNSQWNGPVGGLTFQPFFARQLRFIGEYDGDGVNMGADYMLFRHILIQANLQHGRYFNAGACLYLDLDGVANKIKGKKKDKI